MVWRRYTPPLRTTLRRRCSRSSSSTWSLCTAIGFARSMTTPPILRSIRFEPFLRPRAVSSPSVSISSKGAARVVFAPGLATGAAILRVFVRTPTAAPPTTRANRLTEYSPAPTSSDATRSSAASGMLSKAPLTSAATMYGGRVTGSGPATGLSSRVHVVVPPVLLSLLGDDRRLLRRAPPPDERSQPAVHVPVVTHVRAHHTRPRASFVPQHVEHAL